MNETLPQMGPHQLQESVAGYAGASAPMAAPPSPTTTTSKGDCGCNGSSATAANVTTVVTSVAQSSANEAAPSLRPAEAASAAITAWQNNKRISGLWSINQNRNSWVFVDGIGWKKLANNSDSAIIALSALSAHARERGSVVNYRDESDGMIREVYVW